MITMRCEIIKYVNMKSQLGLARLDIISSKILFLRLIFGPRVVGQYSFR